MSTSMVIKSLEIVDSDFSSKRDKRIRGKTKNLNIAIPENHKVFKKIKHKGRKASKVTILQPSVKTTIAEARNKCKSKEEILQSNLKKLKLIEEACKINLDPNITARLLQRAVTKKPVGKTANWKPKSKKKHPKKVSLTEEDFKKFELEYFE